MLILNIHIKPYLARYARKKYPSYMQDVVKFPFHSLMNTALLQRLKQKPQYQSMPSGNLAVMLNEEKNVSKRTDIYNWISRNDEGVIERMLRLDFNATLHYYFDSKRYNKGIDYNDSAEWFIEEWGLQGLIEPDALLKKHVCWKKLLKERRSSIGEQTELNF